MNSIAYLGTDLASKMLSAMTMEEEQTYEPAQTVPADEQKRYLKRYIDSVSTEDRKAIGNILVINNQRAALNYCNEGTVINLDTLPEFVVSQMYDLLVYKMNKHNK